LPKSTSFYSNVENDLAEIFQEHGYVIRPVNDISGLDAIRERIAELTAQHLGIDVPEDIGHFLAHIHERVPAEKVNDLRLGTYRALNKEPWLRPTYFGLGREHLQSLVGNELAMQNRINLSIQMPQDQTSLLDIHADVFSGETPFQVVQWTPFVDVSGTQSMFFLPMAESQKIVNEIKDHAENGMAGLFDVVKDDLIWLDVPYGNVVIFSPNRLHGNILNSETTTRWTLNCRFTGLFTPYTSPEKNLGSFYLPITPRPVTHIGMNYRPPEGFEE